MIDTDLNSGIQDSYIEFNHTRAIKGIAKVNFIYCQRKTKIPCNFFIPSYLIYFMIDTNYLNSG